MFFLSSSAFAMASSVMGVYVFALYSASLSLMSLSILAVVSVFMLCDSSARVSLIGDAEEIIFLILLSYVSLRLSLLWGVVCLLPESG